MEDCHDAFGVHSPDMQVVDWYVMPKVTCWIETWSLYTSDLQVVCLSADELASLVDICSVVNSETFEWHIKSRDLNRYAVYY